MRKGDKAGRLYRIGEAAAALKLKTCVLRFWESEFSQLVPVRTAKGQRLYTGENLALLRRIQSLLHEQGMTIEGARRVLAGQQEVPVGETPLATAQTANLSAACSPARRTPSPSAHALFLKTAGMEYALPGSDDTNEADSVLLRSAVTELQSLRRLLNSAEFSSLYPEGSST